ncbi:MAG: imidazole glycerol phosphate synthase subunit HisF [Candidatus Latescibacterota bacterium]|nr:imidazole glycerol phosphate synthase subunit HisF [Candidatus Latescibacterota bacterium]
MLAKRIIPCLDVKNGRNVRGVKFSADRDAGDPVELATRYDREGADELVFYDITASADGRAIVMDLVQQVSEQVFIPLTVGGGIRGFDDVRQILKGAADKVSINSAAVRDPDIIRQSSDSFGSQCIVGAIDALRLPNENDDAPHWEIYINGGRKGTGIDALEWVQQLVDFGAGEVVLNSIDADGTREGYDIELNHAVADAVDVPIVASGGAGNTEHIYTVLTEGQASAALAASIFHFEVYSIPEVKQYLADRGVIVRHYNPDT